MNATDLEIITAYLARRNFIKEQADKFKETMAPYQEQMTLLENEMLRRLNERGSQHSNTDAGTAYKQQDFRVKCTDRMAFHAFCIDHYDTIGKDLLTANVAREGLSAYMESTKNAEVPDGLVPPGLSLTWETSVIFRKA